MKNRSFVRLGARLGVGAVGFGLLLACGSAMAKDTPLRVAVIADSPPLSYADGNGNMTGFNVEVARALCKTMAVRCRIVPMTIEQIIPTVSQGKADFAAVAFVATPERRKQVLFTQPYFQSVSFLLTRPTSPVSGQAGLVAVIQGSAQAQHAEAASWPVLNTPSQQGVAQALVSGSAQAALLPMVAAMLVLQAPGVRSMGFGWSPVHGPGLGGPLHMPISTQRPDLVKPLNDALNTLKRNGEFDQINTRFIPFRLL